MAPRVYIAHIDVCTKCPHIIGVAPYGASCANFMVPLKENSLILIPRRIPDASALPPWCRLPFLSDEMQTGAGGVHIHIHKDGQGDAQGSGGSAREGKEQKSAPQRRGERKGQKKDVSDTQGMGVGERVDISSAASIRFLVGDDSTLSPSRKKT